MGKRNPTRNGYVLVLTLGLLTLAAVSLSALARYSLSMTAEVQERTEELQRRWGLLSVEHVLFDRAADILAAQVPPGEDNLPPWPKPAFTDSSFQLGGLRFTTVVADEDAKVNLNLLATQDAEHFVSTLKKLIPMASRLRTRPLVEKNVIQPFRSWGQVFDLTSATTARDMISQLEEVSRICTCWGNRRINVRRAPDAAIRAMVGATLSAEEADELLAARQNWGGDSLESMLAQLDWRQPRRLAARRMLSTESRSYSLWIRIENGVRAWNYEIVEDGSAVCFAW